MNNSLTACEYIFYKCTVILAAGCSLSTYSPGGITAGAGVFRAHTPHVPSSPPQLWAPNQMRASSWRCKHHLYIWEGPGPSQPTRCFLWGVSHKGTRLVMLCADWVPAPLRTLSCSWQREGSERRPYRCVLSNLITIMRSCPICVPGILQTRNTGVGCHFLLQRMYAC